MLWASVHSNQGLLSTNKYDPVESTGIEKCISKASQASLEYSVGRHVQVYRSTTQFSTIFSKGDAPDKKRYQE